MGRFVDPESGETYLPNPLEVCKNLPMKKVPRPRPTVLLHRQPTPTLTSKPCYCFDEPKDVEKVGYPVSYLGI